MNAGMNNEFEVHQNYHYDHQIETSSHHSQINGTTIPNKECNEEPPFHNKSKVMEYNDINSAPRSFMPKFSPKKAHDNEMRILKKDRIKAKIEKIKAQTAKLQAETRLMNAQAEFKRLETQKLTRTCLVVSNANPPKTNGYR
jgi:hypothetical protein